MGARDGKLARATGALREVVCLHVVSHHKAAGGSLSQTVARASAGLAIRGAPIGIDGALPAGSAACPTP
jgi:hypothetical protein